ncbi:MAG: rRNA pseudouridine synthase [Clostridiales bacterium]|nr:rRNA pseudouridine synthase [Clostridiales bacterium]
MERLDKIISQSLNISRSDAKEYIKSGLVTVNGTAVKSANEKADAQKDKIECDGKAVCYSKFVYIMMNKPKGIISASQGGEKTVVDILPDSMKRKNLFPAGRLDKDTTGFVLITDDGDFAHRILSPKNHIPKTYTAVLDKPFDSDVIDAFKNGLSLKNDKCLPAQLTPLNSEYTEAQVIIRQGMYHQIKRMFAKFGITVIELKRTAMGRLPLDLSLGEGECRYLNDEEIKMVENK